MAAKKRTKAGQQRQPPKNCHELGWDQFLIFCADEGIGYDEDDWFPWWQCWSRGYSLAARQEAR